jgi:hypothetical protein
VARWFATAVLAAACSISPLQRIDGGGGTGGSGGSDGSPLADGASCGTVTWSFNIRPWFLLRCGGCHDWTASQLVTSAPSRQKCSPSGAGANFSSSWRLIAPRDLSNSVLWWYVQDCCAPSCGAACGSACLSPPCSSSVPKCGSADPLCQSQHRTTDGERAALECWILDGAPNN